MKAKYNDAAYELDSRRMMDHINHKAELRRITAEQEASRKAAEARRTAAKARKNRAVKEMHRRKKWAQTGRSAVVAAIATAIFVAQTAGLISPYIAIPAMFLGFAYSIIKLCGVLSVCVAELRGAKR